jgi:hypothetical protein
MAERDVGEWDGLWCTAPMTCAVCSADWVAVFPIVAPALECRTCGHMNAVPEVWGPMDEGEPRSTPRASCRWPLCGHDCEDTGCPEEERRRA